MGSGHRKGAFRALASIQGLRRCILSNRRSTVSQPPVNLSQPKSTCMMRGNGIQALPSRIMQVWDLPHFRTVLVHHMVECLHRQPIPRILLVGVHALVG